MSACWFVGRQRVGFGRDDAARLSLPVIAPPAFDERLGEARAPVNEWLREESAHRCTVFSTASPPAHEAQRVSLSVPVSGSQVKPPASSTTPRSDAVAANDLQGKRLTSQDADHTKPHDVARSSVGEQKSDASDPKRRFTGHGVKPYTKPSSSQKVKQDNHGASTMTG